MHLRELIIFVASGCLPLMVHAQQSTPIAQPETGDRARQLDEAIQERDEAIRQSERAVLGRPTEKRAWLGVGISSPDEALRRQLKVPEGAGLLVDFIEPRSPAADAGLQQFDLLLKLDDQWLINPEQFAVLVRMQKPGEEVKLTVVREGKQQTVSAKLVEHETPRLGATDPLKYWMEARPGFSPQPVRPQQDRLRAFEQPRKTVTMLDGEREITVTMEDGHRTLVVRTPPGGKILLTAPIDTPQQMDSLPKDVRGFLKYLPVPDSNFESPDAPPTTAPSTTP
jgi:hypothetical protein